MKSLIRLAAGIALAAVLALPAPAQDRGAIEVAVRPAAAPAGALLGRDRDPLADFLHCLRVLNLSDAQRAAIQQFLEGEKPTLQSLHETIQADRLTLRADANATPPDPCKVGADFLKVVEDRKAIRAEIGKVKDFIESQVTPEQKARFEGCLLGPGARTAAETD